MLDAVAAFNLLLERFDRIIELLEKLAANKAT